MMGIVGRGEDTLACCRTTPSEEELYYLAVSRAFSVTSRLSVSRKGRQGRLSVTGFMSICSTTRCRTLLKAGMKSIASQAT